MRTLRRILKLFGFLGLVVFIIGTLAFTSIETRKIKCTEIEVVYSSDDLKSVNKDNLIRMVKAADGKLFSKTIDQINGEVIEEKIKKHPAIEQADVYTLVVAGEKGYKGVLVVKITNRVPVMRVINQGSNYFIDEEGKKFPVTAVYAKRIIVTTGSVSEQFASEKLIPFVKYINDNDFWSAQIEQIHVERDGNVLLSPLVGGHVIEMGDLDNYEKKLRNLKAFYQQVLSEDKWDRYSKVSVKYNNQVVAKRK
jgi:cell division protein FtsQ